MIGPTFSAELAAAGLTGLPFSWTPEGDLYGREALTPAQNAALDAVLAAHQPGAPPAEPVPAITKAQCLLWLFQLGKLETDIDAFIDAKPDENDRELARIEWRYRPVFRHDHPLIVEAATEFGIPQDYLPDAFRAASLL